MLFLLLSIALGAKIVEYRFGYNFGEIFHDFSGNSRDAVNGDSSTTSTSNTIGTDRGAYFGNGNYKITLPSNDQVSSAFTLPTSFVIASWMLGFDAYGRLYTRYKDSSNQFYVSLDNAFDKYLGRIIISNSDTGEVVTSAYGFTTDTWVLSGVVITSNTMKFYENNSIKKTITFNTATSYTESGTYSFTIGGSSSFGGFIWYFVISDDTTFQSGLISSSTTTTCLTPACPSGSGTPTVIDPYLGSGYLSGIENWNQNSAGTACPSTSYGCAASNSLNCICDSKSCVIESTVCYCWGASGLDGICTCGASYYLVNGECCEKSCLTCNSGSLLCLTCIASHTYLDTTQGCNCNNGYYGTKPLTTANACTACYNECQTCDQSNICLTCISLHASPDITQGCFCNDGYYAAAAMTTSGACVVCYQHCATCNQANICLTCISLNAAPTTDSTPGCICNDGYWGNTLTSANSCTQCYGECATCNSANTCSTCIDPNAVPNTSTNIGCLCDSGYWGTAPLSTSTSCVQCFNECSTCTQALTCQTCIDANATPNTSTNSGCLCNTGYWASGVLSSPNTCTQCYEECYSCSQANQCDSCIDANSAPKSDTNIGCVCNDRYWGVAPLNTVSSCTSCYSECNTCTQANKCSTCIDLNASPNTNTGIGCLCIDGYWANTLLTTTNTCILCQIECKTCTQADVCTTCIADHSSPDTIGCICDDQYWGTFPLSTTSSCNACNQECSLCNQANICTTCIDSNAEPSPTLGCTCKTGFWGTSPLTTSSSCSTCYIDCATCDQANLCLNCKSSNAIPNNSLGCSCIDGFYISSNSPLACTVCPPDCETCSDSRTCLTCIVEYANPNAQGSCDCPNNSVLYHNSCYCNEGYFLQFDLIFRRYACIQCNLSCKTCITITSCLTCTDLLSFDALNKCTICPDGMYLEYYACHNCTSECSTCKDSKFCLTCTDSRKVANETGYCNLDCGPGKLLTVDFCYDCPNLCKVCSDKVTCETCVENAAIIDGVCYCNGGYKDINGECVESLFNVSLAVALVDNYNKLILVFEKKPSRELVESDFRLIVNSSDPAVQFYKKSRETYSFKLEFSEIINEGTPVSLEILISPLYSTENSILTNYFFTEKLFYYNPYANNIATNAIADQSKATSQVAISTSVGIGMISNPAAAWALINTIQIVAYMPLNSIPYSPGLKAFCVGIGGYNVFPNLMEYIFDKNSTSKPYEEAVEYGIDDSVFWINMGPNISIFLTLLVLWPFIYIISKMKIGKIAVKFALILGNYQFSIFLRFWIQNFLETLIFGLIQVRSKVLIPSSGFFNYVSASFGILICIFTAPTIFFSSLYSYHKIKHNSDQHFFHKYGSLFEEFKNDKGFMSSQFYLFFFTRRLIFGFTQVYLTHSISIQYSILLSSSLVQLGFLFYYKPFKEKHIQISVIAGEISTTLFIFLSIFFTCNLSISETAALESIMVYEVIIGVLVQFLVAIYAFWLGIKKVLLKFRKYRNKKKQTAPNITLQQE